MADTPRNEPFARVLAARLSRRQTLQGLMAGVAAVALPVGTRGAGHAAGDPSTLRFAAAAHEIRDDHYVAAGHRMQVLIRWGDKVLADAPAFDPLGQSPDAQEKQFGYNNDFLALLPLPAGSASSDRGLLCVNHEYTNPKLMFPDWPAETTRRHAEIEMAAHGHSVIEIRKSAAGWQVVADSPYNRRLSARSTRIAISGPAAGHPRLKTGADPSGREVIGTLNDCAGGVTPWGTVLIAEENFDLYFNGDPAKTAEAEALRRLGFDGKGRYHWSRFFERFDVEKEPNEPNRFGWMVEFDPYDPASLPVKRTALGRFKHEAATCALLSDGRVVVYSGDDEAFEYLYRFVSSDRVNTTSRDANRNLLDRGTLSVAKFAADGTLTWLPLVFGQGPLTETNGFTSQAEVLIDTRRAADLVGATPLDRPEDVEPNPVNGRVYVMLTNNAKRTPDRLHPATPRADNRHGHILELMPPGTEGPAGGGAARHDADVFRWEILLLAGDPRDPTQGARYHPQCLEFGNWLSAPDNCTFDGKGRLWISTDQGAAQRRNGIPDGMYACDLDGPGRALIKFFYAVPRDAEMCGPCFTPDNRTLFVAIQHPGEHKTSTFAQPSTRWPDFQLDMPPRPAVVAIMREDGDPIG